MKNTNRFIALALCFTLTLGVFAYRPPWAEAVVGVDDAVVIGALLSAFAGGCGLIFSNNGMTSSELAQGLTDKWNEFKAAVLETDTTFAGWLGYEDMDALLQAIVLSGGNALTLPRIVAHKFSDFTTWLTNSFVAGSSVVVSSTLLSYLLRQYNSLLWSTDNYGNPEKLSDLYPLSDYPYKAALSNPLGGFIGSYSGFTDFLIISDQPIELFILEKTTAVDGFGTLESGVYVASSSNAQVKAIPFPQNDYDRYCVSTVVKYRAIRICDYSQGVVASGVATDLSVFAPSYYKLPTIDLPVEGEEVVNPTLSGVGDGTATTIEDLLQQILAQLQANTLAPTLDLAGTESGGNTGTDEDAKPYLPYIPQIFEKIKELPGTLANIWESIKGIPAAIAEKIGAFFTTLWGWLQNIIDAITALPAAIAEKIKALFVPREGYAAEFVADITATYQGRMGLLTYPFTVLADFVGTVATLEEQEPVLRWDAVEWQNKTIIAAGEYNLKSAVSSAQMQTVYMIYKTVVSGMFVVAFLHLCYKKLKEVQRN